MDRRGILARMRALAAVLLTVGLALNARGADSPTLTLPDGSVITIAAVTYGSNHVVGSTFARIVSALPASIQNGVRSVAGQRAAPRFQQTTPTEQLAIWIERVRPATNPSMGGSVRALIADGAGFISGAEDWLSSSATAHAMNFKVFPRRDETLALNFFYYGSTGGVQRVGGLGFKNPIRRSYPHWQVERLPATKRNGDLEVTLKAVSTGHDSSTSHKGLPGGGTRITHGTDRKDGRNHTVCELDVRSLANTNQIWQVAGEELSDATGNSIKNTSMSWSGDGPSFTFSPSLWPSEPAWRIKLELKRNQGFTADEQFQFTGVPLGAIGATNTLSLPASHGPVRVTLAEIVRRQPRTNDSWSSSDLSHAKFQHSPLPEGTHMDLVSAVVDNGVKLVSGSWSSSSNERTYHFRNVPADAKTVDFTFVVQRGRTVEFTITPRMAGQGGNAD